MSFGYTEDLFDSFYPREFALVLQSYNWVFRRLNI
jgi:hypothetical protein